jgi:hypothetical protein
MFTETTPLLAIVAKVQKTINQQSSVAIVCHMFSSPYTAGDTPALDRLDRTTISASSCKVNPVLPSFPSNGDPSTGALTAEWAERLLHDVSKTKDRPITEKRTKIAAANSARTPWESPSET